MLDNLYRYWCGFPSGDCRLFDDSGGFILLHPELDSASAWPLQNRMINVYDFVSRLIILDSVGNPELRYKVTTS